MVRPPLGRCVVDKSATHSAPFGRWPWLLGLLTVGSRLFDSILPSPVQIAPVSTPTVMYLVAYRRVRGRLCYWPFPGRRFRGLTGVLPYYIKWVLSMPALTLLRGAVIGALVIRYSITD